MLPKPSGLWDWAFSCVPGAAHCISPWMDFYFYIFYHSLHLGFTFPTTLYSSFVLCLVIWKCCSRGTTFTVLRRSLRSCCLSIPEQISLMDFHYFSINGCFIPYFHILNQEEIQILAKRQRSRAKGHLKCVPKTIMGPEDCAAPHVSFFWKSVRAQVHLWNIHSLSLSDFSCTEDFCRIGSFVETFCVQAQSLYHDLFFLCSTLIWFTCSRILTSQRNIPVLSRNRIMS